MADEKQFPFEMTESEFEGLRAILSAALERDVFDGSPEEEAQCRDLHERLEAAARERNRQ